MSETPNDGALKLLPFDPIGANNAMGITTHPIGTKEELIAEGRDLDKTGACCRREPGVRGCGVWRYCQFDRKERGGFKGEGPRFIAYSHRTARSDGGRAHENCMTCYYFVQTLQARMNLGIAKKLNGEDHERIRIVAQEGELYVPRRIETVNPRGGPSRNDIRERQLPPVAVEVPRFPRPHENPGLSYDQKMRQREAERDRLDEDETVSREEEIRRLIQQQTAATLPATDTPAKPRGESLARPVGERTADVGEGGAGPESPKPPELAADIPGAEVTVVPPPPAGFEDEFDDDGEPIVRDEEGNRIDPDTGKVIDEPPTP